MRYISTRSNGAEELTFEEVGNVDRAPSKETLEADMVCCPISSSPALT